LKNRKHRRRNLWRRQSVRPAPARRPARL